jgi:hypothetical protein
MGLLIGQEKFKRKKLQKILSDGLSGVATGIPISKPKTNDFVGGAKKNKPQSKPQSKPEPPKSQSGSYVRKSIIGPYPLRASFFKRKEVTDRFEY